MLAFVLTAHSSPKNSAEPGYDHSMALSLILSMVVNDDPVCEAVSESRSLLEFLREDLNLTGTKHGCDVGDCGACTVMVDDKPRLACITLAADCESRDVRTIEGISDQGQAHRIQQALNQYVAAQCGYCTPGIVMSLMALKKTTPSPSQEQIIDSLAANICRCTGYTKILAAARDALMDKADP